MTPDVQRWIDIHLKSLPNGASILDVGAYDVNGHPNYPNGYKVGLDMRPGPNVDVVANGNSMPFPDNVFDCVICAETLEHDSNPFATIKEISRVLKPNGMFIITVPGIGFPRHDYPSDYWRFTVDGVRVLLQPFREARVEEYKGEKSVRGIAYK